MKRLFFILLIFTGLSCKKIIHIDEQIYHVEDFRKAGMNDYQTLMAAVDSLPENSTVRFDPKTYIFNHTPIINKGLNFYGPATLKREDQRVYTLKEAADEFSTYIILNNTYGIIISERFIVSLGKENNKNTIIDVVTDIKGDTLILDRPLGKTVDQSERLYPAGTNLFKNINFFWVLSDTKYTDRSCSFHDLTFDGNRNNNSGSYSWYLNAAVTAISKGTTQYKDCKFINSPGETIVGHNADIRKCMFYNLNGSGFHTVADKLYCNESEIHSYLSDNVFENTNQIPNSIGGHSEGAITHSSSGGYYTATRNTFKNIGASVLGGLYPSISINDWGTSNITFTGNTIDGAGKMVYLIYDGPGEIHDVKIEKNIISNLGETDYTTGLSYWPGIILKEKSNE